MGNGNIHQRKLVAVLAADIAGYSALMNADEGRTVSDLKQRQAAVLLLVNKFDGRLIDTAGDGIFADFASAVNAVQCALEIQNVMAEQNAGVDEARRMQFRIGINIGDVIFDAHRIYGEGANIAARLEQQAEPGSIYVSANVVEQVKGKLDVGFEHCGAKQLRNIPEAVETFRLSTLTAAAQRPIKTTPVKPIFTARRAIVAAVAAIAILGGGVLHWRPWAPDVEPASIQRMKLPLPDKPSVAVLPFSSFSSGRDDQFFTDGITEDIITTLAALPSLFVVARNSTFKYRGKAPDIRTIAEALGVRHVVEGSVRRETSRVRINVRLIDALSGHNIWAEVFDRNVGNIFEVQERISKAIASKLNKELMWTESSRRTSRNLDAYHLTRRANQEFLKIHPDTNRHARQLAERAIAIDPTYARAYAVLAYTHAFDARWGWVNDRKTSGKKAFRAATKAVQVDDREFSAHQALAAVLHGRQMYDRSIESYEKAIALNPNNADLLAISSNALLYAGRFDDAIKRVTNAMRLNPYYRWFYPNFLGRAYFGKRDFRTALPLFEESIRIDPKASVAIRYVAAIHGHLGAREEAAKAVRRLIEQVPKASVQEMQRQLGSKAAELPTYLDGLRKAGLRETASGR